MGNSFGINPRRDLLATFSTGSTAGTGGIGNTGIETARAGLGNVSAAISMANAGLGAAQSSAGAARGDAASMRGQAQLVNTQGNAINRDADALAALVPQLDPYKDKLGGYGDDLAKLAQMYLGEQKDMFGQGRALVTMDPSAGGLAAEYLGHYLLLSPDKYVGRAASDTQASYDNALAQQERQLARRGVSPGSGASSALMQQWNRALATALAANKSIAWDKGEKEQRGFLGDMTSAADTLYNMGLKQGQAGEAALKDAGDMARNAAGIVTQQGALLQDAGQLRANVGQLFAAAGNLFGNAGGLEIDAGRLTQSAYQALESAYESAANYYLNVARAQASGGGGGGVNIIDHTDHYADWLARANGKAD